MRRPVRRPRLRQPAHRRADRHHRRLRGGRPPVEPRAGRARQRRAGGGPSRSPSTPSSMTASTLDGQSRIARARGIRRVWITPDGIKPADEALEAIADADLVVIGPGSLYTSLLPPLLVPGIRDALRERARAARSSCATSPRRSARRRVTRSPQHLAALQRTASATSSTPCSPTTTSRRASRRTTRRAGRGRRVAVGSATGRRSSRATSSTTTTPTVTTRASWRRRSSSCTTSACSARDRRRSADGGADSRDGARPRTLPRYAGRAGGHRAGARCCRDRRTRRTGRSRRGPGAHAGRRPPRGAPRRRLPERRRKRVRLGRGADALPLAWLRGAVLAHGSLSIAAAGTHLELVVAVDELDSHAAAASRTLGYPAGARMRRGRGVLTWKNAESIIGAPAPARGSAATLEIESRLVGRAAARPPEPRRQRRERQPAARGRRGAPPAGRHRRARATDGDCARSRAARAAWPRRGAARPKPRSASLPLTVGLSRSQVQRAFRRGRERRAAPGEPTAARDAAD